MAETVTLQVIVHLTVQHEVLQGPGEVVDGTRLALLIVFHEEGVLDHVLQLRKLDWRSTHHNVVHRVGLVHLGHLDAPVPNK